MTPLSFSSQDLLPFSLPKWHNRSGVNALVYPPTQEIDITCNDPSKFLFFFFFHPIHDLLVFARFFFFFLYEVQRSTSVMIDHAVGLKNTRKEDAFFLRWFFFDGSRVIRFDGSIIYWLAIWVVLFSCESCLIHILKRNDWIKLILSRSHAKDWSRFRPLRNHKDQLKIRKRSLFIKLICLQK